MKVFEEQHIVPPSRVGLHAIDPAEARPASLLIDDEERNNPLPQIGSDLAERDAGSRSGGVLDRQVGSEELVVSLKRSRRQVVEREPNGATPIRVPAEHSRGRLGRFVVDGGVHALDVENVGMVPVHRRQGPQPVR